MTKKEELAKIVGGDNVLDDPQSLDEYSHDESFVHPMKPQLVVKPKNAEEVQGVVEWANKTLTPLVPISSGAPHFRGDTVPTTGGAVIVDLSRMNKIVRIFRQDRSAIVEPGVTFAELQPALEKEGLRLNMPLLPRSSKSVIGSMVEREPVMIPKYHWDVQDPLFCTETVWGTGEVLVTGGAGAVGPLEEQWKVGLNQKDPTGPAQLDFVRILQGAQGTMGIVTWASIKCEVLPQLQKLFFVPSEKLEALIDFAYRLLRFRYADEFFFLNKSNLACVLRDGGGQIGALRDDMPSWILILVVGGYEYLPEERLEYQEKDIREIAQQCGVTLVPSIPGARDGEVLELLKRPAKEPWRLRYKGGCQDIFFLTTLDKTPDFIATMCGMAASKGYPATDIGVYLQPQVHGCICHCEFNLPYDPNNAKEVDMVDDLLSSASENLMNMGAFFSRPYDPWADMAYRRDAETTAVLRKVKKIFDPNNIMNPGKLCF